MTKLSNNISYYPYTALAVQAQVSKHKIPLQWEHATIADTNTAIRSPPIPPATAEGADPLGLELLVAPPSVLPTPFTTDVIVKTPSVLPLK